LTDELVTVNARRASASALLVRPVGEVASALLVRSDG